MHLRCWFARKMSQFTRFCGVKFLAWKSGCVKFLTNIMSVHNMLDMRRSLLIKTGFKCLRCMTLINSCPTRLSSREQRNIAFSIAMGYDSYHLFQWVFLRKCGQIEVTHVFPLTGAILSDCVLRCNILDLHYRKFLLSSWQAGTTLA